MNYTRENAYIIFLLAFICAIIPQHSFSWENNFNLSVKNGLPTNRTYRTIVDKNGYLWISTDKGVVKYNGYTTKTFNAADGIANDDVWNLFEDYKGRIWLASISDEIGYIYKDKYHKAILTEPTKIYPINFINYPGGILFNTGDKISEERICVEKNDTITSYNLRYYDVGFNNGHYINRKRIIVRARGQSLDYLKLNGLKFKYQNLKTKAGYEFDNYPQLFGPYYIPLKKYNAIDTFVRIVDVEKDEEKYIHLNRDEDIITVADYNSCYYLTTTEHIYKYDHNLNLITSITHSSIISDKPSEKIIPITFIDNAFGNRCIATSNSGVFIEATKNCIKKCDKTFLKYKYLGTYRDSLYYWWNSNNKTLYTYNVQKLVSEKTYPNLRYIHKAVPLASNRVLLLCNDNTYLLKNDSLSYAFPKGGKKYWLMKDSSMHTVSSKYLSREESNRINYTTGYAKLQDCIIDEENLIRIVSMGYSYSKEYFTKDSAIIQIVDSSRYETIVHYAPLNFYIVQGKNQILIDRGNKLLKIDRQQLMLLGINSVQQILVDSQGNVFIKTPDKLLAYNPISGRNKSLYKNYNLNNASIHLYKNTIVAVGRFGVVYSKILPGLQFSNTISSINFKTLGYYYVNNSYIIGDELYINTDMGEYSMALNDVSQYEKSNYNFSVPYKLYISSAQYNGPVTDTLNIRQDDIDIDFDFINTYGDGNVKYTYSINNQSSTDWILTNRIILPVLTPGIFYKMKLIVSDDSWVSNPYTIYIHLNAYWWQTTTGKRLIFFLSLLALGGLTFIVVLTTRYILNLRHAKENKYLELELKSIYAQLNPHFIFNTLSNIVYYIKKDRKQEAYKYLNTFSKLLRSYIKSSRNKWLPLSEEIENIENYILLQMVRFENKFDYSLNIDEGLDTENILLPSLLLQPLVENAIHHGLQQKSGKGMLILSFKKTYDDNVVVITIDDDGIGRTKAKEYAKNSLHKKESFGSNLIEDLITIYKRYELFSIDIDYHDKEAPATGTLVTLTIKYEP